MKTIAHIFLLTACLSGPLMGADDPDIIIADFEGSDYGDWKVTGEAFGPCPARGTLPEQMKVTGFEGRDLMNNTQWPVSPLLPAQPLWLGLGQHDLGPCREPGHDPLAGAFGCPASRCPGNHLFRIRSGGQRQYQRLQAGRA